MTIGTKIMEDVTCKISQINTPGSHLMKTYQRAPITLAKGKGSFVGIQTVRNI